MRRRAGLMTWHGDRSGATAMEYALIIAALGGFVVAGATVFGGSLNEIYGSNTNALTAEVDATFSN